MSKNLHRRLIPIAIIVAGIIISGIFLYVNKDKGGNASSEGKEFVSNEDAAQKALDFINKNLLQGQAVASFLDASEENGVYKIHFKIAETDYDSFVTKNGKLLFIEGINMDKEVPSSQAPSETGEKTIGNFNVSAEEVCEENGKPIVYFFGSKGCPHCQWEHPVMESVALMFKDYISFHNNMDTDNDKDVFSKYSSGSIPTLALGCKYYRVGSGESMGEAEEANVLTALICKLTGSQPGDICSGVKDLINKI